MYVGYLIVDQSCALAGEVILEFLNVALVSGSDRRREDDGITLGDLEVFVCLVGGTHERGELVPLCSGGKHHDAVGRVVIHVFNGDDRVALRVEHPRFTGDLDVVFHAATVNDNFFAKRLRYIDDMDQALYKGRECRDDDTPLGFFEDLGNVVMHAALGDREAGALNVGGIRNEHEVVLLLNLSKFNLLHLRRVAFFVIKFHVTGVDDVAVRGFNHDSHGVGNGVRDGEEFKRHVAHDNAVIFLNHFDIERLQVGEFFLALADHQSGQVARVERRGADLVHDVGEGADVVEVPVRYNDGLHFVTVFLEVFRIGKNEVNSRGVFLLELKAGINNDNSIFVFHQGHVFADLLNATERDHTDDTLFDWG